MISVINFALTICLAVLIGYFLLRVVDQRKRPAISVPKKLISAMIILIPIFLMVPAIMVILTLYQRFNLDLNTSIITVLFEYSVGKAFILSFLLSVVLLLVRIYSKAWKYSDWFGLGVSVLFVLLTSWSSHGTAVAGWTGFVGNTLHLISVSVWIGVLFVVSWFTKELKIEALFFRWFSLVAVVSVLIIILSGFLLMSAIVPDYVSSWLITYGQLLLIKHLLFIPLLAFGLHHFLLGLTYKENHGNKKILTSFKVESMLAAIILFISAVMTEQTPPHEVVQTLQTENLSWFAQFFLGELSSFSAIQLQISSEALILLVVSVLLFIYSFWLVTHNRLKSSLFVFLISVIMAYSGLMTSVEVSDELIDQTIYHTIEEAINDSYEDSQRIDIILTELTDNEVSVVYTVDKRDLVAEKLLKVEEGYNRLPAAMLTIGGTAIVDEDQKIRTFRVRSGNWHDDEFEYTYVTFGVIRQPDEVARVQIHYEGGSFISQLENETFLNVVSSKDKWDDQHPIDFLSADGRVIETYARNVMEEGVYCH